MSKFSISPPGVLSRYVDRIWGWANEHGNPYILPGTGCDLFFFKNKDLPALYNERVKSTYFCCPRYERKSLICSELNNFVAIRFKSGSLRHFIPMDTDELTDRNTDAYDIWGEKGKAFESEVINAEYTDVAMSSIYSNLENFLLKYKKENEWLDELIDNVYYMNPEEKLQDIYDASMPGRRQIERLFIRATGVSPKYFQRTARFQRLIRELLLTNKVYSAGKSLDSGYYDQSHLIHEFRYFTGKSPSEFISDNNSMSHFYNTCEK